MMVIPSILLIDAAKNKSRNSKLLPIIDDNAN